MSMESFSDMTYPGGKRPRRSQDTPAPAAPPAPSWDAKPMRKMVPGGEVVEVFPIGALAMALNRAAVTMRLWDRNKILPKATFRLAAKNGVGGRRYYTRAQIIGIQRIAEEEGMLHKNAPITEAFTTKCVQLFEDLKKKG